MCSTGGRCRSKSACNSFTSLLANYVHVQHTPLSFASWCMLHIHNSASLCGVCANTPLSFASLVYLLHIHNSAAPRLCILFAYTILSSDVRHYYIYNVHDETRNLKGETRLHADNIIIIIIITHGETRNNFRT